MKVAVIGAGLAGLTAGCELADLGHTVTVFEKRPFAGGKTYSYLDRESGEAVDNGQHVFMNCTTAYREFLRKIGTLHLTRRQKRLKVRVYGPGGNVSWLAAQALPAPLHLALSFTRYGHLRLADKLRIGRTLLAVHRMTEAERKGLHRIPFSDWLRGHGQTPEAIRDFWDFVLVPTLNCRADDASTADALFVLREGFLKSSRSAGIGLAAVGLSELHVQPAVAYIERHGGSLRVSESVAGIELDGHERPRAIGIRLASGTLEPFEAVVCAVPHTAVSALLPPNLGAREPFASLAAIPTAPIVNLHFWFDRPVADFAFAAFIGSELQWVFNRNRLDMDQRAGHHHLVVSLSDAAAYMPLSKADLRERFLPQLGAALPAVGQANLLKFAAIKERDATFVPAPGLIRPGPRTPVANLVLAGAYTDTGWPATMESAVRGGTAAAQELHATFRASWHTTSSPEGV